MEISREEGRGILLDVNVNWSATKSKSQSHGVAHCCVHAHTMQPLSFVQICTAMHYSFECRAETLCAPNHQSILITSHTTPHHSDTYTPSLQPNTFFTPTRYLPPAHHHLLTPLLTSLSPTVPPAFWFHRLPSLFNSFKAHFPCSTHPTNHVHNGPITHQLAQSNPAFRPHPSLLPYFRQTPLLLPRHP